MFPYPALREALLNAVVHKDYSSGIPIQISVYQDKIVLWSSGQLPQDWTLERLMGKHPSAPYNPLIANAFFRAGYIESWGRGIEKINRECKEYDLAPPLYDYGMSGLMLTFHANPQHLIKALGEQDAKRLLGSDSQKTSVKTPERILQLLEANPAMTLADVAAEIEKTLRAVELASSKLVKGGAVEIRRPAKRRSLGGVEMSAKQQVTSEEVLCCSTRPTTAPPALRCAWQVKPSSHFSF